MAAQGRVCSMYRTKLYTNALAGDDLGESAIRQWVADHWNGYLRSKWLEHLQGIKYWSELDRDDFGLFQRLFQDKIGRASCREDMYMTGKENVDDIIWAQKEKRAIE